MRFQFNPFTDKLDISGSGPGVTSVDFLTGNTGGQVAADASFNIFVVGNNASGITTVGNLSPNTLTIFGLPSSTTQIGTTRYATNAEAAAQTINNAALTPSNITSMFSTNPVPSSQGGTGLSSPAAHQLIVTNGSSAYTSLGVASNGQIPIGSIGSDPVLANITSLGGTITITNGPGTINLESAGGGGGISTIDGDLGGSATGATITFSGGRTLAGSSVGFSASGSTVTLNNTDSSQNTFLGSSSGSASVSGSNNTAVGYTSLQVISSGSGNVAIGSTALASTTTHLQNVAVGFSAGLNLDGDGNVLLGYQVAKNFTSGNYNNIIGITSGNAYVGAESSNIIIGNQGIASENNVIRIGTQGAGDLQQNKCFIAGIFNNDSSGFSSPLPVFVDSSTGQLGYGSGGGGGITTLSGDISGSATGATITLGGGRTLAGSSVGFTASGTSVTLNNTDSNQNTFLGASSGGSSTTGNNNVGVGYSCLANVGSGARHVGVGSTCLTSVSSSIQNTAIGYSAGLNLDGDENVLLGYQCAKNFTSGSNNIIVGVRSGNAYTASESNNIIIGNLGVVGENHTIRIGDPGAGFAQQNMCFIAGIHNATVTGAAVLIDSSGQLGDIASSERFKENIQDMSQTTQSILDCRPVSFNYKSDKEKNKCFGMIAEEVHQVFPDLVIYKDGEPYSIKYHEIPALLIAEIQKLKKEISDLRKSIQ